MKPFERILFVDDDPLQREVTSRLYHTCSKVFHNEVDFIVAGSWEAGIDMLSSSVVDIAIFDLVLPPMNALETIVKIASAKNLPPIVVITGAVDDTLRKKCFEAGVDDFVLKDEVRRHPEVLCERCYNAFLRHQYRLTHGTARP